MASQNDWWILPLAIFLFIILVFCCVAPMVKTNRSGGGQVVLATGIPVFRRLEVITFMEATADVEVTEDVEVVTAVADEVMVAAAIKSAQQSINAQQERIL